MRRLLLILLIISSVNCYSQERVNRAKLGFESVSDSIIEAKGWAYNSELGEWIDYDNVINKSKDYKDQYKSLAGKYMMSKSEQNFISLQFKTLSFNNNKYHILIADKWTGSYEYPSIQRGWEEYVERIAYIYTDTEYSKIKNISNEVTEIKTLYSVTFSLRFDKYDETKLLDLIQTELTKEKSKYASEYIFPIIESTEGNIRFYVPSKFMGDKEEYNFDDRYFETDKDNFSKLILEN